MWPIVWWLSGCHHHTHLIQNRALPEESRTVNTTVRLLVGVYPQMLRQVRLLPEPFAALRARIRTRLNVNAAVLQQRALLLELLLADGAAHVQRHARRPAVLYQIGQHDAGALLSAGAVEAAAVVRLTVRLAVLALANGRLMVQIRQRADARTKHRVIDALLVLEVRRILQAVVDGAVGREAAARIGGPLGRIVRIAVVLLVLWLVLVGRIGHVLRPQRRMVAVLKDEMRGNVCTERWGSFFFG